MSYKKQSYFFNNLILCADYACQMAQNLNDLFNKFNATVLPIRLKKLHTTKCEEILLRHEMIKTLRTTFITPIEREDIFSLSTNIDNVIDNIEDIAIHLYTNNFTRLYKDLTPFTLLIIDCCITIKCMLEELTNFRKSTLLPEYIAKMNELDEKGKSMYIDSTRYLHSTSVHKPIEIIGWSEIYKCFKNCLASCGTVTNTVQWVVIRNA